MMVRINRRSPAFENNKGMGSFVDVSFKISADVHLGNESVRFDTKIHYVDKGEGEPLLLVHGIGQSLYTWRSSIDFFAKNGYRVIAPDLPGFGYSSCPNIYYTVEEYALIIKAFLDVLKIKKVSIAGFATGALAALVYAHTYPKRTQKIVIVSPGGPNENYPFTVKLLTTWLGHKLSRFILSEPMIKRRLNDMFFDTPLVTNKVADEYFAPFKRKLVRETMTMAMAHFDDTNVRSLLKSIKHRVLVFSGQDDKLHDESMIRAYAQNIPGASHIQVRNCGHIVHEEKPVRFNDESLKFLKTDEEYNMFS